MGTYFELYKQENVHQNVCTHVSGTESCVLNAIARAPEQR